MPWGSPGVLGIRVGQNVDVRWTKLERESAMNVNQCHRRGSGKTELTVEDQGVSG